MTTHPAPRRLAFTLAVATLLTLLAAPASSIAADDAPPTAPPSPSASSTPADDDGDDVTWSVRPASESGPDGRHVFDYTVAPGQEILDWVSVTNFSARAATFQVYAADATTDYDTAAFTLVGADQASADAGAWTAVDENSSICASDPELGPADCGSTVGFSVTLDPGEQREYPFSVQIPADAAPGDHAAGIVASFSSASEDSSGALINVAQRVGARIYLRVDGPLTPGLAISGAVASYRDSFNPAGPGTAVIGFDLTDTGNTRLSAQPTVQITGPFGIRLGEARAAVVANLMPGGTAHVTAEVSGVWPALLAFADVTVAPIAADGAPKSDPLPAAVTASARTWAVPWAALAVLAIIAGAVVGVVVVRRRRWRAWQDDASGDDGEPSVPASRVDVLVHSSGKG
ncbi:MAG: DUF916 domain-containing protein [Bifidobacteriaceae bacterium]|jgi:hypothetical protein|nr:DUF916 domain-containing protein [Bifidobacteriaceae bacterium]